MGSNPRGLCCPEPAPPDLWAVATGIPPPGQRGSICTSFAGCKGPVWTPQVVARPQPCGPLPTPGLQSEQRGWEEIWLGLGSSSVLHWGDEFCPLSGRHEPLPATWAFLESGGSRLRPQPGEPLSAQPPSAAAVPETPLAPWPAQAARHLLLPRQALCRPWPWDGKVPRVAGGENAATASFFLLWSARKRRPVATSLPRPQEVWLVGGGEGPLRQAPAAGASGGLLPLPAQASWWLQGPLCPLLNGLFSVLSSP